ncbi:MAG: ABC transporter permease [Planctomycetota bacterium]
MLVPLSYNLRSLFVRRVSTLLTVVGIGATVAVVAGVISLQQGFKTMFAASGREDVAIFLRPGATNEGDSMFTRERALTLTKKVPEIAVDDEEAPLAAMECYLAVRLNRLGGGETNVPIRGVQPATFAIHGEDLRIVEGRHFEPGTDEVIVGQRLPGRMQSCRLGDAIQINITPFRVVGVFASNGPFDTEIWGDLDRMLESLERIGPNRVMARLRPATDLAALAERMKEDKEVPSQVQSERDYLTSQTTYLSATLLFLGGFLGLVMGTAAVFTATNTMLAAVTARTHEIGILLSTGFRPLPIFFSFLFESLVLGLLGGAVGCLFTLPLNGVQTGTTNFNTFTEVAFAFRVTPPVLLGAVLFSLVLGLLGGAWPAWRAARLEPTAALRRQ